MVLLHIASMSNNPYNGMHVVIPEHVAAQSRYAQVGLINLLENPIPGLGQQLDWKSSSSISELPEPFNKPDLVVFHGIYIFGYIRISNALRKEGIPYVLVPHSSLTIEAQHKKRIKKWLGNRLFFNNFINRAVAIQYLSKREQEMSRFNCDSFVGTNGISIPSVQKQAFHSDQISFVYIGRLEAYQKGLDYLFAAVRMASDELLAHKAKIYVYGPHYPEEYKNVCKLFDKENVGNIVQLMDAVTGEEKQKILLDSDIFIQTSRFEGMPMGIIEAMSYGIPCLVTEGTTLGATVTDGDAGWCAQNSAESIAQTIKLAITEREQWAKKSENARKVIQSKFSWDMIARDAVTQYEKIVRDHGLLHS